MKIRILLFILFTIPFTVLSQEKNDYSNKVNSIDSIVETIYTVLSGKKGEKRDWELFKFLFIDDAKLASSNLNPDGKFDLVPMTANDFTTNPGDDLFEQGYFEKETRRQVNRYGNMANIFSHTKYYTDKNDKSTHLKSVNSFQLFNDGKRWWIVSFYWGQKTKNIRAKKRHLK